MWTPNKAEKQGDDDCFGELQDPSAPECQACLAEAQCALKMLELGKTPPTQPVLEIVLPTPPPRTKQAPHEGPSIPRPGEGNWWALEILKQWPDGWFEFADFEAKFRVINMEQKLGITNPEKICRKAIMAAYQLKLITKRSKNTYQKGPL